MIKLIEVNEQNFKQVRELSVADDQAGFLDSALGIVARGYIYRDCRARVLAISDNETVVGLALVRDLDEAPACYDLQQFMIDSRYQGRGAGTEALRGILSLLEAEGKYDRVEVCVKRDAAAALRVYEKLGFSDTGYIDESVPDSLNLVYVFPRR